MLQFFQSISSKSKQTNLFVTINGQSNAVGVSMGAPTDPILNEVIPKTQIWTGTEFEPLQYGVNNGSSTGFGIELNLGLLASQDYSNIYIVKNAVSGTSLGDDGTLNNWDKVNGDLYGIMVTQVNLALTNLAQKNIEIKDYIAYWNQGEKDANNFALQSVYETNLNNFVLNQRDDFINGQMFKFICTRLSINLNRTYVPEIRVAQENVIANTNNSFLINQDDLSFQTDQLHFTGESQNILAQKTYNLI